MTVDISAIKAGDEITVRLRVRETADGCGKPGPRIWCDAGEPTGSRTYLMIEPTSRDRIVEHHPAPPPPPQVGDRVTGDRATGARGKLLGVSGEHAWVHRDGWACPVTIPSAIVKKVDQ